MLVFQSLQLSKMNMISNGKLKEESISSATYTIVINDFRKKLVAANVGQYSITEQFTINWSKFYIRLYIACKRENEKRPGYLSLHLHNRSDWMVRASREASVKVIKFI